MNQDLACLFDPAIDLCKKVTDQFPLLVEEETENEVCTDQENGNTGNFFKYSFLESSIFRPRDFFANSAYIIWKNAAFNSVFLLDSHPLFFVFRQVYRTTVLGSVNGEK